MRIGHLKYINAIPFYTHLEGHELIPGTPAELNAMMAAGKLDCSLMSAAAYLENIERYMLLPGLGIAAERRVISVILHTRHPIKRISLTPESATSSLIVHLMCKNFWHIDPIYTDEDPDAILTIGDKALLNPKIEGYEPQDLAALWHEKTALPLTFAVWACQRSIDPSSIVPLLEKGLETDPVPEAHKRTGLSTNLLIDYFSCLQYRLSLPHIASIQTMAALNDEHCTL